MTKIEAKWDPKMKSRLLMEIKDVLEWFVGWFSAHHHFTVVNHNSGGFRAPKINANERNMYAKTGSEKGMRN